MIASPTISKINKANGRIGAFSIFFAYFLQNSGINNKDNPFNDINTHFRKGGYLENDPELRKKSNNS